MTFVPFGAQWRFATPLPGVAGLVQQGAGVTLQRVSLFLFAVQTLKRWCAFKQAFGELNKYKHSSASKGASRTERCFD